MPRFPRVFSNEPKFGLSALALTPPMPSTKHTREHRLNTRKLQGSFNHHSQSHTLVPEFRFLCICFIARRVRSDCKNQGVFEAFFSDSPWSDSTLSTPTLFCDPNIIELRPFSGSGPRFGNREGRVRERGVGACSHVPLKAVHHQFVKLLTF